eukprot:COSAG02_NODE_54816_length_294_cov_0.630769_2_plen_39_part_01
MLAVAVALTLTLTWVAAWLWLRERFQGSALVCRAELSDT